VQRAALQPKKEEKIGGKKPGKKILSKE